MRRALWLVLLTLSACPREGVQKVRPQLQPPGDVIDFGTIPVLNEKTIEVELQSVGRAKLTVSNVSLAQDDGIFTIVSAPASIEGGDVDKLVVKFVPFAEQSYETTLAFDSDDEEHPHLEITLKGIGSTRAAVVVDPESLDFGRIAECGSSVLLFSIKSQGTADLVINSIAFVDGGSGAFSFVGSTRTPATVATTDPDSGLPGEIQVTVRAAAPAGSSGTLTGTIRLETTDPDRREVLIPLTATVNKAPVATIAPLANGAPGQQITLDGSGSSDADGDSPLTYLWTMRSKPLSSATVISPVDQPTAAMTLDPSVPGQYEVQLDVTDATGAKSCQPARATVVATPAQKLLVEMFWDNAGTDIDLHVVRNNHSALFITPDDCYYQNRTPDWGLVGDTSDDPQLVRDALTGYGPEVFGYVNPVNGTYRVQAYFQNTLASPTPASMVTVRVYQYGVLKAETSRTLTVEQEIWKVLDIEWPTGNVTVLP
jgi:hypothetical protein